MSCEGFNFILSHKDVIWELWEDKRTKSIKIRVGGSYKEKGIQGSYFGKTHKLKSKTHKLKSKPRINKKN